MEWQGNVGRQDLGKTTLGSCEAEQVVARFEKAGATLLAMRAHGYSTNMRRMRLETVNSALEAYGWEAPPLRAPAPDAAAISDMDEVMGWLGFIPDGQFVMRRIVGTRALVHPLTGRHLFAWRRLAGLLGADHKTIQRWHGQGIGIVVQALRCKAGGLAAA